MVPGTGWSRGLVQAETARQAAEIVCGEPVIEGADRGTTLYLKIWPLIPSVEWFHLPSAKTAESREGGGVGGRARSPKAANV